MTDLSSLGATTSGVWTRASARALLTDGKIDELVRSGAWQVVWPGTYADGGYELSAEQRACAAVLATGGVTGPLPDSPAVVRVQLVAVAVGRTAARVWEFPLVDDASVRGSPVHDDVGVWRQREDVHHGGRTLHRHQLRLGRGDLVQHPSGLWLTSPLRTLVDCRRLLSHEALVCAMDMALHGHQVRPEHLADAAVRTKGWRDAPAFRRAVELADPRAESPGETLTRLVLQPALPGLVPQLELRDDAGRTVARFDLADPAVRLAVEFDGRQAHSGQVMLAHDRRRDERSAALGWWTERVTWHDVRRQPQALLRRVVARHAALRRQLAA